MSDDDTRIEVIELEPGQVLCAFVLTGVREENIPAVEKYWADTVAATAAGSMTKFLNNHFRSRGD